MAKRLRLHHQEDVKGKIQASVLITRLHSHAMGDVEMTPSQVQAAKILLDKRVSNAPQETEISGPDGDAIQHDVNVTFVHRTTEQA